MQKDIRKAVPQASYARYGLVNTDTAGEGFKAVFDYQKRLFGRILWAGKDSIVRIVPGNDGKNLFPQVINASTWTADGDQTEYLSDTFYMTQTLSSFGESRLDICSNLRPGSDEAALYPESPLNYFCNKIHRTMRQVQQGKKTKVKYNDRWKIWTSLQGSLPFPRPTLMFQAICIHLSGRDCLKDGEGSEAGPLYGVVGINNKMSINKLLNALVAPMDRKRPIGSDNNTFGALAEDKGNILYLNSSQDADGKRFLDPSVQESSAKPSDWNPTQYDIPEPVCRQLWVPWEKCLRYLTVREQLELLAAEFGADTVNYVFSLSPQWTDLEMPERIAAFGMGQYSDNATVSMGTIGKKSSPGITGFSLPTPKTKPVSSPAAEVVSSPVGVDMSAIKDELARIRQATSPNKGVLADALAGLDIPEDIPEDEEGSLGIE